MNDDLRSERRATRRSLAAGLVACGLTSACSLPSLNSIPLPGGAATGHTYTVTVVFADVSTLVVRDAVRVNDVPVGEVSSIGLTPDLKAKVVCRLQSSVQLPVNAVATITSTSLLGEDYVALAAPAAPSPTRLSDGAVLTGATSTDPDTEQVLGALSAVLNGGSIGDVQVIASQLNDALRNRTGDARSLLERLRGLAHTLDANKQTLVAALDGLDKLSRVLAAQRARLGAVITQLPAGIDVLVAERPRLVALVQSVGTLGTVATRVINASRANLVADLAAAHPVLEQLSKRGTEIAKSLNYALTFPFGKDALAAFKGDYAGFYAALTINADDLSTLIQAARAQAPATGTKSTPTPSSGGAPLPVPIVLPSLPTSLGSLLVGVLGS